MSSEIKLKKKTLYSAIVAVIVVVLVLTLFLVTYFSNREEQIAIQPVLPENIPRENVQVHSLEEIQNYKIAFYEGLLCRYSCSLSEIKFEGVQVLFPEQSCVTGCINKLKEKGYTQGQFSGQELLSDNLLSDIDITITNCRDENSLQQGVTTENSQYFFDCASSNLELLKESYSYLN